MHLKKYELIKVSIIFIFVILSVTLITASDSFGTFKQNQCINLVQTCSNCTYINATILYPNSTIISNNDKWTQNGNNFNYTFCNTDVNGLYQINGIGNPDGQILVFSSDFTITPSGNDGTNNLVFILFITIAIYTLTLIGFFKRNEIMTILGGMFMMALGVYLYANGIIIYQDWITQYFSMITTGLGFILTMYAALSLLDINY
jgi:hypothetical protein